MVELIKGKVCDKGYLDEFIRYFHSIKGSAATFQLSKLNNIGVRYDNILCELTQHGAEEDLFSKIIAEGLAEIRLELNFLEEDELHYKYRKYAPVQPQKAVFASILMMDDDVSLLELVKRILERAGFTIHIASEYKDAISVLREFPVDLFLVDYFMPDMDGFQVLKMLRSQGLNTPVVIMTGDQTDATREKALSEGALDIINKPIKTQELATIISLLLHRCNEKKEL